MFGLDQRELKQQSNVNAACANISRPNIGIGMFGHKGDVIPNAYSSRIAVIGSSRAAMRAG